MDAFDSIVLLTDMFLKGFEQQWNSHQMNALRQISDIVCFVLYRRFVHNK